MIKQLKYRIATGSSFVKVPASGRLPCGTRKSFTELKRCMYIRVLRKIEYRCKISNHSYIHVLCDVSHTNTKSYK